MQQKALTFLQFKEMFQNEESCREHLFKVRWSNGFKCPKCGHTEYYKIKSRHLFQCAKCQHQTSVTSGTIFHKTRVSLVIWFWVMYLVSRDKRGISALSVSREFKIAYLTAWTMLHKIREAMSDRDSHYDLYGMVEVDEGYFGASTKGKKRGRGTDQAKVLVSVSVTDDGKPQFAKMDVIEDLSKETIQGVIIANTKEDSTIKTDGYSSYLGLKDCGFRHDRRISKGIDITKEVLKSLHILISNVKAFITGTYHGLKDKHLQSYLNEYCYRFNRRFWQNQLFDRLLVACVNTKVITYAELIE